MQLSIDSIQGMLHFRCRDGDDNADSMLMMLLFPFRSFPSLISPPFSILSLSLPPPLNQTGKYLKTNTTGEPAPSMMACGPELDASSRRDISY